MNTIGKTITVQLKTLDGKPMPNVAVVCIGPESKAVLKGHMLEGGGGRLHTRCRESGCCPLTLIWRGLRQTRVRRLDRYIISPLSRDELHKARSKLKTKSTFK